jgi:uncharacterized protein involved in type VI secretion and phage assembly
MMTRVTKPTFNCGGPAYDQSKWFTARYNFGVTLGQVSNTDDPQKIGRIKVKFQLTGSDIESGWIQVMSFYAGQDYGSFFMAEIGQSALVSFANGDPSKPFVLGFLYNGVLKPPVSEVQQQDVRVIKTRSGKIISFNDSADGNITVQDEKHNSIVLDTKNNAVEVTSQGDLTISAKGNLTIKANALTIENTSGSVKIDLGAQGISVEGGSSIKMKAAMIDLN